MHNKTLAQFKLQTEALLDELQSGMESNLHLENSEPLVTLTDQLSARWHFLSEGDRDYVQAAQIAITERITWNK